MGSEILEKSMQGNVQRPNRTKEYRESCIVGNKSPLLPVPELQLRLFSFIANNFVNIIFKATVDS